MGYAERTGLTSKRIPKRYLWTDAFAVCNFLGLARATGEQRYGELALRLVEQVHHILGRHRHDDPRTGWISGLSESEGESHPTWGGLRIGKQLAERGPNEPFDDQLEWDRDGQYFHYLTMWMHALDQVTRATGQPGFNLWAQELAEYAYAAFTYYSSATGRLRRMYWKMSIDLTRPLVSSMGQHDPLDGYITYLQLHSAASRPSASESGPDLADEIEQFSAMVERGEWATTDPLGIGGLLVDAFRVQQLMQRGELSDDRLLVNLLNASVSGLEYFTHSGELQLSAELRLAFRELGLVIGLHAVGLMREVAHKHPGRPFGSSEVRARLQALMDYMPLPDKIESFWRDPGHRSARTWMEHRDINEVMLATSLVPDGFLLLMATNCPLSPRLKECRHLMMPIQDLLNRIRWDSVFAEGDFVIGFYDRLEKPVIRLQLKEVWFEEDDHFDFYFMDEEGEVHSVPFHRVTDVYKDDELIWHRERHE